MAANDKEVLVKADHVKVYFKGKKRGQTVKAVDDVSFEIMKVRPLVLSARADAVRVPLAGH